MLFGTNNSIFHSGKTTTSDSAKAIRIDNPWAAFGEPLNTSLHIQNGSVIVGNIVNSDPTGAAEITFGREYSANGSYHGDPDFIFSYDDEILGMWNYDFHDGTTTLKKLLNQQAATTLKGNGVIVGNINSAGIIAPGNSIGTLTINGNLTQISSSDLQIEFGDGGYDRLIVRDTATLDGSLSLIPTGYLTPGNYQFIDASLVTGNFATINNFSSSILQTSAPASGLEPGKFNLSRNSYTSILENKQQSLASAFELSRPTANGDMANILNRLDVMNLADIRQATNDFSPYFHNSVTTANLENIRTRSTFFQNKVQQNEVDRVSPFWFSGYSGNTRYDKTATSNNFKAKYAGFMLGVDKQFESEFQFGVAGGYTDSTFGENDTSSNASSSAYDGYLYGSWSPQSNDAFYLQSILELGFTNYKTNRDIPFLERTATSDHDSNHYSAFLGGGYKHKMSKWSIEPRAGLQYIHLDEDGFTEFGAGAASFTIQTKKSDALLSSLGFEVNHTFKVDKGLLIPSIRADWFHNFSADTENTISTLQTGESFSVDDREASEDSLDLAVALTIIVSDTVHGHVGYQYSFTEDQEGAYLLNAGLSYYF